MKDAEWWVMRVLKDQRETQIWINALTPTDRALLQRQIDRGDLALVNNELCEPIEVFDGRDAQEDANIRAVKEHKRTGCVHKVVLNAEI